MSLSFTASIGPEGKKGSSFGVTAKSSPLLSMLSLTAPTFSFTWQAAPESRGSHESSCTGASTTHSSNSGASE